MALIGAHLAAAPDASGLIYDLGDGRVELILPGVPRVVGPQPRVESTGQALLVLPDNLAAPQFAGSPLWWHSATDVWRQLPDTFDWDRAWYASAWTGEELLVWGGNDDQTDRDDGARWQPEAR